MRISHRGRAARVKFETAFGHPATDNYALADPAWTAAASGPCLASPEERQWLRLRVRASEQERVLLYAGHLVLENLPLLFEVVAEAVHRGHRDYRLVLARVARARQ